MEKFIIKVKTEELRSVCKPKKTKSFGHKAPNSSSHSKQVVPCHISQCHTCVKDCSCGYSAKSSISLAQLLIDESLEQSSSHIHSISALLLLTVEHSDLWLVFNSNQKINQRINKDMVLVFSCFLKKWYNYPQEWTI